MIADIQTQEVLAVSLELATQFAIIQDAELANVGGGSTVMSF